PAPLGRKRADDRVRDPQHQRGDLPRRSSGRDDASPGAARADLRHRPSPAPNGRHDLRAELHRAHPAHQADGRCRRPREGAGRRTEAPTEPTDEPPSFEGQGTYADHGRIDWSGLTSIRTAKSAMEIGAIVALAAAVFFGLELILRWTNTPTYVF